MDFKSWLNITCKSCNNSNFLNECDYCKDFYCNNCILKGLENYCNNCYKINLKKFFKRNVKIKYL